MEQKTSPENLKILYYDALIDLLEGQLSDLTKKYEYWEQADSEKFKVIKNNIDQIKDIIVNLNSCLIRTRYMDEINFMFELPPIKF